MIVVKTKDEIALMKEPCKIAGQTLKLLGENVKPGLSTLELDKIAADFIKSKGAKASFLDYNGFPAHCCISINCQVIHGIPSKNVIIEDGDIVSIDIGAFKNGFHGDCAQTFCVGNVSERAKKLVEVTRQSFFEGIKYAREGARLGDIGAAVSEYVESHGFSAVKEFVGHGVGYNLHEDPAVPNYGSFGKGVRLEQGMTLAVEPMINEGGCDIKVLSDGWTVETADGSLSAHFEHTIAITNGAPLLLTEV